MVAQQDKRKAAVVKEAFDKFDGDTAISKVVEKFKLPIRAAQEIYTGFKKALGDHDAASSAMEQYIGRKMGQSENNIATVSKYLGQ